MWVVIVTTSSFCCVSFAAGEKLSGLQVRPSSQQEMRENVDKVLQFVASKKIRMHQTSAKGKYMLFHLYTEMNIYISGEV